jgi:hypothetical protein
LCQDPASGRSPASVTLLLTRATLTMGLPFAFSSRVLPPPSFSITLTALSSALSARTATAVKDAKPRTSAAPVRLRCVVFISGYSLISPALSAGNVPSARAYRSLRLNCACIQEIYWESPPAPGPRARFVCHGLAPSASFLLGCRKVPLRLSLSN